MLIKANSLFIPIKNQSVDCVVTSPPYWGLRKYDIPDLIWDGDDPDCEHEWRNGIKKWHSDRGGGKHKEVFDDSFQVEGTTSDFCLKCNAWKGQLGLEPSFQLYLQHLLQIFDEVKRVLKPEGTCFVNLGDSYGGSGSPGGDFRNKYRGDDYLRPYNRVGISPKSLCQIPYRFSIAMSDRGWILRNIIIWKKPNAMPQSVKDRFSTDFEPVFFFTKQRKYYFEQQYEGIQESSLERNKYNWNSKQRTKDPRETRGTDNREAGKLFNSKGRNKRCVWSIPTQSYKESHFAVFPEALIEPMIKAGCPHGGIVLDPFMGTGTTIKVAKKFNRKAIGLDLAYQDLGKKRIEKIQRVLSHG